VSAFHTVATATNDMTSFQRLAASSSTSTATLWSTTIATRD